MRHHHAVAVLKATATTVLLCLLVSGAAWAGGIPFGGDPPDNLWQMSIRYCTNGIVIHAHQTRLSNQAKRFSLRLSYSSIPLRTSLPRIIAHGGNRSIVAHRH